MQAFDSIVNLVRRRARATPRRLAFEFLDDEGRVASQLDYGALAARASAIAAELRATVPAGDRALLIYPPGRDFVEAFFGCLAAGVVPTPAFPPDPARLNRTLPRLLAIAEGAGATLLLTTSTFLPLRESVNALAPGLGKMAWLATDVVATEETRWEVPAIGPATLAFLQYTSGSTTTPRGVMVTHGNLVANCAALSAVFGLPAHTVVVSWLPPYHDMGLIGCIVQPVYAGWSVTMLSPVTFLRKPRRWLEAITRARAIASAAPNFAYDLCVRKIPPAEREGLDLSSWSAALIAAEPVRTETIARFVEAFGPYGFRRGAFCPCYGLAEATLVVSGSVAGAGPRTRRVRRAALERNLVQPVGDARGEHEVVGCGGAAPGHTVVIVDPDTGAPSEPGRCGEIYVSGPSVAPGYWGVAEAREFGASVPGRTERFLRTGDIGFLDEGQLYIVGRMKDLIILRGRNLHPEDIERVVETSHPSLRPGCGAAFSVDIQGEERVVVAHEVERGRNVDVEVVAAAIRQIVADTVDAAVYAVLLLKAGSIPKTSSGKIQRHACRAAYLGGSLDLLGHSVVAPPVDEVAGPVLSLGDMPADLPEEEQVQRVEAWLRQRVAGALSVPVERVGVEEPLTRLGVDSLVDAEIAAELNAALGAAIQPVELLTAPGLRVLARDIVARRGRPQITPSVPRATPRPRSAEASVASFGQERVWFFEQLHPRTAVYHVPMAVELLGALDVGALRTALEGVVRRHEALRTGFTTAGGHLAQVVHPPPAIPLPIEDLRSLAQTENALARASEHARQPFDLETPPLLRANLFRLGEERHVLVLTCHHLCFDGTSARVLAREVTACYRAAVEGRDPSLPALPMQYADFARLQRRHLEDASLCAEQLSYWKRTLVAARPCSLPVDRTRPTVPSFRGGCHAWVESRETLDSLRHVSRHEGATLFMGLLAVLQASLHRETGETDIVVGSPIANRNVHGSEALIGFFVNTTILRTRVSGDLTFRELLRRARDTVLGACRNQDVPFERIVQEIQPARNITENPLFQVMLVQEPAVSLDLPRIEARHVRLDAGTSLVDLTLSFVEGRDGLRCALEYSRDLYEARTVARAQEHLSRFLATALARPDEPIGRLPAVAHEGERCARETPAPVPPGRAVCMALEGLPLATTGGADLATELSYWKAELAGAPVLELATDRPRPPMRSYAASIEAWELAGELTAKLAQLARSERATPFLVLLAGFQLLLGRRTGQTDVVVGTPIANRDHPESDGIANLLAVRTDLRSTTFRELLGRVRDTTLEAYAHRNVTFEKLVEELQPQRDLGRHPVFQVLFDVVSLPPGEPTQSRFDVTLHVLPREAGIGLRLLYATELFDATTIKVLLRQYQRLLEQVASSPDAPISLFSLIDDASYPLLPDPRVALDEPRYEPAPHELARVAAAAPLAIAVRQRGREWSYRELDRAAARVARALRARGLARGDRVAVTGPRSFGVVAAMLGTMRAGACVVPIDPSLPSERQRAMLSLAQVKQLVRILSAVGGERRRAGTGCDDELAAAGVPTLVVEPDTAECTGEVADEVDVPVEPGDPAYAFFTSGTTGTPKLIVGSHQGLSHFLAWQRDTFGSVAGSRFAQLTGLSFDVFLRDVFFPLTQGAVLCLPPDDTTLASPERLIPWLAEEEVTALHTVPSLAQLWLKYCPAGMRLPTLRCVFFAGEPLTDTLVRRWRETLGAQAHIVNLYGPTETTLAKCFYSVPDEPRPGIQPVGRPLPHSQALVLSEDGRLCGVGEPGEVVVRTPFRTLGYAVAEEADRARFFKTPFRDDPRDILYRTGDRGRYLPDGTLELLGRVDAQVKIRGVRAEPEGIAAALAGHPAVAACVVVTDRAAHGEPALVAYVARKQGSGVSAAALRAHAALQLPAALVPSHYVFLDRLPLTANGKVDRQALPAASWGPGVGEPVAPQSILESTIAGIWSETLGIDAVSADDDFFALGGHSFAAMRAAARLRESFQVELPLRLFFERPTVASMARAIELLSAGKALPPARPHLWAEAVLDAGIRPAAAPGATARPAEILLTGATGFLGAFLVDELLAQTDARVHCLVRCRTPAEGKVRLEQRLRAYGRWLEARSARIDIVPGDLAAPRMGLSPSDFATLAGRVDAIYHNGALVNFIFPYDLLKPANVLGTQEALRLACQGRAKPFHYISTLAVFGWSAGPARAVVMENDEPGCDELIHGYAQSKWVAERLALEARRRGLPVTIYRPGAIGADRRTGLANPDDFLAALVRTCLLIGCAPDFDAHIELAPVDYVARALVHLSLSPGASGQVFHLSNPHPAPVTTVVAWLQSMGHRLELLSLPRWLELARRVGPEDARGTVRVLQEIMSGKDDRRVFRPRFDCTSTVRALAGTPIACPPLDPTLLGAYLASVNARAQRN